MPTYTPANSLFDGLVTNLHSILCILIETFHMLRQRRQKNKHWRLQIWHFYWSFSEWWCGKHGSEKVNILSPAQSVSMTSGYKAGCQNTSTLTASRPGWVTSNKVSGRSLPTSVSSCITSFPLFINLHTRGTDHILKLSTMSQKTMQTLTWFFHSDDSSQAFVDRFHF